MKTMSYVRDKNRETMLGPTHREALGPALRLEFELRANLGGTRRSRRYPERDCAIILPSVKAGLRAKKSRW